MLTCFHASFFLFCSLCSPHLQNVMRFFGVGLWCGARASRPETQKKLKYRKSDSKVTFRVGPKVTKESDSKVTKRKQKVPFLSVLVTFESLLSPQSLLSHFFVTLEPTRRVTFESLFRYFNFVSGLRACRLARHITRLPRGPKDQKNSRFRSRLKISIENEIFERATHRGPNRDIEIKIFERDQKFRSRLKISIEINFFWSLGPLGRAKKSMGNAMFNRTFTRTIPDNCLDGGNSAVATGF